MTPQTPDKLSVILKQAEKFKFETTTGDMVMGDMKSFKSFITTVYSQGLAEGREEAIDYISFNQGWEESGDIYRKHFGIKEKFTHLKDRKK
jgi:hypothetical protein